MQTALHRRVLLCTVLALALPSSRSAAQESSASERPPNVLLVYADDLGWGDTSAYGATRVRTPAIDRLAREGLRFTDAHAPAATCTPSRYALLTGEYAWRRPGTGVLPGDAALVIEPGRRTLPELLRRAGYATAVVGKWHLGLGTGDLDWNGEIRPGPLEVGFDHAYLVPATGDRVPTVYVEDHRVVGLDPADPLRVSFRAPLDEAPSGRAHPELLRVHPSHGHDQTIVNGISRIGWMSGGTAARWVDEDMADVLTRHAVSWLEQQGDKPFFLYFATHDIHVPRTPHARFVGKTEMGRRGDAIVQLDACVGALLEALDRLGKTRDTLVLFTSDNGAVVDDGYREEAVERLGDHHPSGPWRGGKYSAFEGGTRVPLIVRWPERVTPGTSGALVGQIDFLASLARLVGVEPDPAHSPDSRDHLAALLGRDGTGRGHLVEQAGVLALRSGSWKLIEPGNAPAVFANVAIESGQAKTPRLFDLTTDPGETTDLAAREPEILAALQRQLAAIRAGSDR